MVTSGIIPYIYSGIYPYRLPANDPIMQMSGMLIEQAMTVIAAELHRFQGSTTSPTFFEKYIQPDVDTVVFNPRPDGSNLDGTIDGIPGGAYFIDYIADLRTGLSAMLSAQGSDLGGTTAQALRDWLLFVGSASGTHSNFTRGQYSLPGVITSSDVTDLGASGVLYDIDLREVSYQPYSRVGRVVSEVYKQAHIGLSPFFPNFQNTNGGFVTPNSRDLLKSFVGPPPRQVSDLLSGLLCIDGDMFFPSTDFCVAPGTATRDNLEGVITHNAFTLTDLPGRVFRNNADNVTDPRARAQVLTPALAYGGYTIGAINSLAALPYLVVPSGTLSFSPSIKVGGGHAGSGYYVFDNSFWILDGDIAFPSGVMLLNPHTANGIWFKIADQTSFTDQAGFNRAFTNSEGLIDAGTSIIRVHVTGDAGVLTTNIAIAFLQYNKTSLDLSSVSNTVTDFGVFGPFDSAPSVAIDACSDGSQYIVLSNSIGVFRNLFFYDSGFNFTDSKFYLTDPLYWIQNGIFGGGTYGATAPDEITELIIDPDPANDTVTAGTRYTIDTSAPAWRGGTTIDYIMDAQEISGDPNISNGTWLIVQTTSHDVIVFRGTLSGTSIIPQEVYLTDMTPVSTPATVGSFRYEFYLGSIN